MHLDTSMQYDFLPINVTIVPSGLLGQHVLLY